MPQVGTMVLAECLLRHAGAAAEKLRTVPDLDARLEALLSAGRAAWPTVRLPDELFARHLAGALNGDDPLATLSSVHASDLYLACACAHGDAEAIACFDRELISQIPLFVARQGLPPGLPEELQQAVRVRLLVADGDQPPRIAGYTGRGPLGGWLRMATARVLLDLRRASPAAAAEVDATALEGPLLDPELAFVRREARAEFEEALAGALRALSDREATMLKLHLVQGLGTTTIGRLIGASERTARRWLAETRAKVLEETRRRLAARLSLTADGLGRLFSLVESQMDVSIRRLLTDRDRA